MGKEQEDVVRWRITINHKNVKEIESKEEGLNEEVTVRGPVRMPTKVLTIMTRKAPNGNGTVSFDRFEMRIHKRVIDITCSQSNLKAITQITLPPGLIIEALNTEEE